MKNSNRFTAYNNARSLEAYRNFAILLVAHALDAIYECHLYLQDYSISSRKRDELQEEYDATLAWLESSRCERLLAGAWPDGAVDAAIKAVESQAEQAYEEYLADGYYPERESLYDKFYPAATMCH